MQEEEKENKESHNYVELASIATTLQPDEEEENKFDHKICHNIQLYSALSTNDEIMDTYFTQPQASDYIDCIRGEHNVANCNVAKRIVHLLQYYNQSKTISVYDYISSLKHYSVPKFMEDWHQCKTNHFKNQRDYAFCKSQIQIKCEINVCQYIKRHARDRGKDTYKMKPFIDHKNTILMDRLDAIHTFIFHSMSRSSRRFMKQEMKLNSKIIDSDSDIGEEHEIWGNNPQTIKECNLEQMVYILSNCNVFDKVDRLIPIKQHIIEYFESNDINGDKFIALKRKIFSEQISKHMNNKKIKGALGKLYNAISKYDVSQFDTQEEESKHEDEIQNELDTLHPDTNGLLLKQNSKFITNVSVDSDQSKLSYYAFGYQYRYTDNLIAHPFYIKPKYPNIKTEIFEYFVDVNKEYDRQCLLEIQTSLIDYMEMSTQMRSELKSIISNDKYNINWNVLWDNDVTFPQTIRKRETFSELIELQYLKWTTIPRIITTLCEHVSVDFDEIKSEFNKFVYDLFTALLDAKLLDLHMRHISENNCQIMLDKLSPIYDLMEQSKPLQDKVEYIKQEKNAYDKLASDIKHHDNIKGAQKERIANIQNL
eukprot:319142_1